MRYLIFLFVTGFFSIVTVNGQLRPGQMNIPLLTGDLLFCSATGGELSKAIDQATQTGKETHFDHVGIVELKNDTVWVLHAAPQKGVCMELIGDFLKMDKIRIVSVVYRLKPDYARAIPRAIKKAHSWLGEPYKFSYKMSDPGYYCSEYIYQTFSADSIFTLNPMTFKSPQTGEFLPAWIDHYRKLGVPVPEGEPGCNPNGLAASVKLESIGILKIKNDF